MLSFELKKLWKKKTILFIIITSFFMSVFVNYKSNVSNIEDKHPVFLNDEDAHSISILKVYEDVSSKGKDLTSFIMNMEQENDYYVISGDLRFDKRINVLSCDEVKKLNLKSLEFLEFNQKYMEDNSIKLNATEKVIFDWALFEHRYGEDNDVLVRSNKVSKFTTNLSRRLIYNSDLIFGIIPILIIGVFSSDIFSGDFEEGQINLIYTQSLSKRKILLSKLISIFSLFIVYMVFVFIFMALYSVLAGIDIGGFREIYQVYLSDSTWSYIKAYNLYFIIMLIFLVIGIFFSSVVLLISRISSSKAEALSKVISILLIFDLITKNLDLLKNPINPFFASNYLDIILGRLYSIVNFDGSYFLKIDQATMFPYYIFILLFSIIIISISLVLGVRRKKESKVFPLRKRLKVPFEVKKYIYDKSIYVYLISASIFVISIFFIFLWSDEKEIDSFIGNKGRVKYFESIYKETLNKEHELKNNYLKDLEGKSQEEKDEALDFLLGQIRESVEKSKITYQNLEVQKDGLINKDSSKYFNAKLDELLNLNYTKTSSSPYYLNADASMATKGIYRLTYEEAIKKAEVPIINYIGRMISVYDEFRTEGIRTEVEDEASFKSHSAVFSLFRMLKQRNLDYILLLTLSLMYFSGFILDKDGRDSIDLIYTQPLNRSKYYLKKMITTLLIAFIGLLLFLSLGFLLGLFFEGIGAINFPIVVHDSVIKLPMQASVDVVRKAVSFIPVWRYLLRVILAMFFQLFFLSSLMHIVSIFTRNKLSQSLVVISICIGLLGLDTLVKVPPMRLVNPIRYLAASDLVDNSLMVYSKLEWMRFENGILVLVVWGVLLSMLGTYLSKVTKQRT